MILKGKVFKFGDDINTDGIISGRYKFSITDMKELSRYLFGDIRPNFYKEITPGQSVIAGGKNFGMGSSREQAPWVIKEAGIICVVAMSFARIFYRNAFNIGLPLIEADTSGIDENCTISIDLDKGVIKKINPVRSKSPQITAAPKVVTSNEVNDNVVVRFNPWNTFQKKLISCGGIINYLKKYKDFNV
ncbi:MAG: 3-isopropylmalate dehydratase [Candidatus Omnitrophica bacterium]|nr:3-isopropylmalate dehydratase [Candidatus Omnitrophota bacterium]MBU0897166.1 3-isopropylmalate dehydratase [Candidatus Omnitrophota bacterium]MBU1810374.1 3-isopropylmalate dehydratase [Candidatus Omnitrophota bacterium]